MGNRGEQNLPALGMSTPLTAKTLPNATVRLFDEAGSNPGGVNAVATPASATAMRDEENIIRGDE
jgi:hypothetical protein